MKKTIMMGLKSTNKEAVVNLLLSTKLGYLSTATPDAQGDLTVSFFITSSCCITYIYIYIYI